MSNSSDAGVRADRLKIVLVPLFIMVLFICSVCLLVTYWEAVVNSLFGFSSLGEGDTASPVHAGIVVISLIGIMVLEVIVWSCVRKHSLVKVKDIGPGFVFWFFGAVIGFSANLLPWFLGTRLGWAGIDANRVLPLVSVGGLVAFIYAWGNAIPEEIGFRGIPLVEAVSSWPMPCWVGVVVLSSVLFAFGHSPTSLFAWGCLIGVGVVLCLAWFIHRSLWLPIGMHLGVNFAAGILGFGPEWLERRIPHVMTIPVVMALGLALYFTLFKIVKKVAAIQAGRG